MFPLNLEFSAAFRFWVHRTHRADGRTDGRSATLIRPDTSVLARMCAFCWCFGLCEDSGGQCVLFSQFLNSNCTKRGKYLVCEKNRCSCNKPLSTKWHKRRPRAICLHSMLEDPGKDLYQRWTFYGVPIPSERNICGRQTDRQTDRQNITKWRIFASEMYLTICVECAYDNFWSWFDLIWLIYFSRILLKKTNFTFSFQVTVTVNL